MADGEHTVKLELTLSELALRHLKERAEKLGWTLDAAAADAIEQQFFNYDDYVWPDGDPRTTPHSCTTSPPPATGAEMSDSCANCAPELKTNGAPAAS